MQGIAKAVVAFFTSLGTGVAAAASDGFTVAEVVIIFCGVMVATFGVWVIPNKVSEP